MSSTLTAGPKEAISALAGRPAPKKLLVDLARLEQEYVARRPDISDLNQMVIFGTSGHRGSPLTGTFTESHILAITQAICDFRLAHGTDDPLSIGKDTGNCSNNKRPNTAKACCPRISLLALLLNKLRRSDGSVTSAIPAASSV
ncbi:MAG: hypothetical protein JOY54_16155 [Acidobacteriaceae bacterium]|nr:hypothetical protein [Acidobacteriaceae bacterium]